MPTYEDLKEALLMIQKGQNFIDSQESMNGNGLWIGVGGKSVFEIDGYIYRIMNDLDGLQRILTGKYVNDLAGYELILPDIKEEELSIGPFFVTKQEKVISGNPDDKFDFNLPTQVKKFFDEVNFIWYQGQNAGLKNDKPVILDWCANLTVNKEGLVNRKGELLWPIL